MQKQRGTLFSQLKVVKTDKSSCFQQSPLQDQLLAKLESPSLDKLAQFKSLTFSMSVVLERCIRPLLT